MNDLHACIQYSKPALPGDPRGSLFTHQLSSCHPGSQSRLVLLYWVLCLHLMEECCCGWLEMGGGDSRKVDVI